MNEYELVDALNSTMAQSWTVSQYGLSILTGYLLIAHFIGRKLTFFQVSFVNAVFLLMHTLAIVSNIGLAKRIVLINLRLDEAGSDMALQSFDTDKLPYFYSKSGISEQISEGNKVQSGP